MADIDVIAVLSLISFSLNIQCRITLDMCLCSETSAKQAPKVGDGTDVRCQRRQALFSKADTSLNVIHRNDLGALSKHATSHHPPISKKNSISF